ncbi:MAG: peptidylprolyl isomerase [Campylobacterota bacterium]|nr:peptidylprolyl isomerase [Campylobacterota bacterium]
MITWMQQKKKMLVVVMWITVLAFVGAGFVGWGSYQYGSKSSSVAKVGDVEIKRAELQNEYNRLYSYYSQLFEGELPQEQADELQKIAMQRLIDQAYLMNLADKFGVVVSDDEVASAIVNMQDFKKDGVFNKEFYISVLKNARISVEDFENSIKRDILLNKIVNLFDFNLLNSEKSAILSSVFLADDISIKTIDEKDVKISISDKEVEEFWSKSKQNYMSEPSYEISYIEVKKSNFEASEEEAKEYFEKNRAEFATLEHAPNSFEEVKEKAIDLAKLKKAKTQALKERIAFKKDGVDSIKTKKIYLTNDMIPFEDMQEIESKLTKEVSKPIQTKDGFVVLKVLNRFAPEPLIFTDAKEKAKGDLKNQKMQVLLEESAQKEVKNFEGKRVGFVTKNDVDMLSQLSAEEASFFLNQLFGSPKKTGYVKLDKKIVLYKILEQKLFVDNKIEENVDFIESNSKQIKKSLIDVEIIKHLQKEYKVQKYYEGV